MSDTIDDYKSMKQYTQELRRAKLAKALELFKHHDLKFSTSNNGVHCTFEIGHRVFDVWPSTDRWRVRGGVRSHFGISAFVVYFNSLQAQALAKSQDFSGLEQRVLAMACDSAVLSSKPGALTGRGNRETDEAYVGRMERAYPHISGEAE